MQLSGFTGIICSIKQTASSISTSSRSARDRLPTTQEIKVFRAIARHMIQFEVSAHTVEYPKPNYIFGLSLDINDLGRVYSEDWRCFPIDLDWVLHLDIMY